MWWRQDFVRKALEATLMTEQQIQSRIARHLVQSVHCNKVTMVEGVLQPEPKAMFRKLDDIISIHATREQKQLN